MPNTLNAVVDISHHNGNINLQLAAADGIIGVIHKATQGTTGIDAMYQTNRTQAANAGLLWGAYHNGNINLQLAAADGIIGGIHKATQGTTGIDAMYQTNRTQAANAGLLWGAYHFGTGGDGAAQAQHFLDVGV